MVRAVSLFGVVSVPAFTEGVNHHDGDRGRLVHRGDVPEVRWPHQLHPSPSWCDTYRHGVRVAATVHACRFRKGSMHPWIVLASHKISGLQGLAESHARLR